MKEPKRLSFRGKYAGVKIEGTSPVTVPFGKAAKNHLTRAFYLTSQMESPDWGSVQSYDGAAMSGGPMHWVAVYPKTMRQGGLFGLLRAIEIGSDITAEGAIKDLWGALRKAGWYVSRDGKLRSYDKGQLITGRAIRDEFTPEGGAIGRKGTPSWNQALEWAELFYALLSNPGTFEVQKDYSIEYLVRGARDTELDAYQLIIPGLKSPEHLEVSDLGEQVDFAMCVYHSFSPNAPGAAKSVLAGVVKKLGSASHKPKEEAARRFASTLIRALGKKQYGAWADTPDGRNRYDRTRLKAMKSKLWPDEFFNTLMPRDLA